MSIHILVLCVQASRQLRMFNLKSSIKSKNSQNHSLVLEDKENWNWWLGKLFIRASVCWRWLIVAHLPRNVDFRLRPPKFHHDRDAANEKIWHHKSYSRCKYELSWKSSKQFKLKNTLNWIVRATCFCWLNALVRRCRHSLIGTTGECFRLFAPC